LRQAQALWLDKTHLPLFEAMIAAMASFLCSDIPATPSTDTPYNFTVSLNFLHFRNNTDTPLQKLPAAPGDIPSLFAVDMPGNKVPPFHNSMFS